MRIGEFLLCGLLVILPVFANESDDRQTATSLRYVSHELDTRQDKLSAGTNAALTYTNAAGNVEQRTVKENLNGGTTDTSLPQVNAVNTGLGTKQDDISASNDHTAVTYTGQVGIIGQKGIYQDSGTYAEQTDNLIDAKTFNAALKNGLDNEFVCADRPDAHDPNTNLCWLWEIHNTYNAAAQPYVSATGTVVQNGTPTPTNPIEPVFYRQGNMVLRRVGDYADSYDATTQKITRRVGVKVLNGTETNWSININGDYATNPTFGLAIPDKLATASATLKILCNILTSRNITIYTHAVVQNLSNALYFQPSNGILNVPDWISFIAEQYAAGTPVTVWYPLETPVEEDWTATTYNENVYIPQNQ